MIERQLRALESSAFIHTGRPSTSDNVDDVRRLRSSDFVSKTTLNMKFIIDNKMCPIHSQLTVCPAGILKVVLDVLWVVDNTKYLQAKLSDSVCIEVCELQKIRAE